MAKDLALDIREKADIHDPLTINLARQTRLLLKQLPADSQYHALVNGASSKLHLLTVLSQLLSHPALTYTVATTFRPLLLDLCARWLHDDENEDERFEALCYLLEIHQEVFPVFSAFLRRPNWQHGPLAFITEVQSAEKIDATMLHRKLVAYYRVLQANRKLPGRCSWPLAALSKLIWSPHPDNGVRLLAINCYALQSGMMEGERVKMEKELIGDISNVECPIAFGINLDGSVIHIDGWVMQAVEVQRVVDARQAHLEPQNYFTFDENDSHEPIHPAELSPLIVNIHGVLMLCSPSHSHQSTPLIETHTAVQSLRILTIHHSLRVPTLLTSAPSSGKSLLISHLASILHPGIHNQVITVHLADTSLDARSLFGSYVSSTTRSGTFEWKEGVLVRAMREGKWVVFEDIDRASSEVLGAIKPLVESLGLNKWIGERASLNVPNRGIVEAAENFAIYATRSIVPSRNEIFTTPSFYGAHKFHEVIIPSPTADDLRMIVETKFPRLAGVAAQGLIRLWEAVKALGPAASVGDVGLRELDKFCSRVNHLLSSHSSMDVDIEVDEVPALATVFPNPSLREEMYLEARDVFFGAGARTSSARAHLEAVAALIAEHLDLSSDRRDWLLQDHKPEFEVEKDVNGKTIAVRVGRTRLPAQISKSQIAPPISRPFAMHRSAVRLLSRITTATSLGEPVLLTGETGTGKTSAVTHLASLLNRNLVSLNMSSQTESSDLIGGFKPVDAHVPGMELQERFLELFGGTFSRKRNAKFEESVRQAVKDGKWKKAVVLWRESTKLARAKISAKVDNDKNLEVDKDGGTPRKRRKVDREVLNVSEASWEGFERDVQVFEVQHVHGKSKFAFAFVEGLLVKALRSGYWILLDEINLASPETLECISALLQGPTASITLTEQGSLESVPRHPDFRLFACMNPATDVGKRDLPPNIRSRFTEVDVPPPDSDKETLISIVDQYIGGCAVGDRGAIMDVAEFYLAAKRLADERKIADGSNHRPHYSMRTLARALMFAADMASAYSLRRALWEGCLMTFTMILDEPSASAVTELAHKHLLAGVRNPRSLLSKEPSAPQPTEAFVKLGSFFLRRGQLPEDPVENYIMTPSVESKLINLARMIAAQNFPVLIEGPTSSGKTSSIEYLAKRTGHRFVRINNHEHTDIQEYLGSYVSDPVTGRLVFQDGLLVRALRNGDWIVLDELNLAPTDVLEALNRLLDENRELVIPETQEVVRPHPQFMLFATQNPPGLYAGRKVLSRAFRNRFLEVQFEDVPQVELETILCQRCRIAPSHGQRIVAVFRELQKRRQSSRIFESKHGFATLRDLFRWAGRNALSYQELAENGFMLLAERTRREDDKTAVKEVIESVMKVRMDVKSLYDIHRPEQELREFLGFQLPSHGQLVWTSAMRRLFILVARALRFNEPVLLVGETGCGKTSVCQYYADILSRALRTVNCHQNTETADLIGGLRPIRNRAALEAESVRQALHVMEPLGISGRDEDPQSLISVIDAVINEESLDSSTLGHLQEARSNLQRLSAMFEWHDGPLIEAMRRGDIFLLDEISLADDSVLERLNSVLEPDRSVVLAEKGGDYTEDPVLKAIDNFKLVATMNPGGDYGKKELSPALRNRFTEIWVPPLTDHHDFEYIIDSIWRHEGLKSQTVPILTFVDWLCTQADDRSLLNIRDILAWTQFTHDAYSKHQPMPLNLIFHHAAHMTFLDGLGSMSQFASFSPEALDKLRSDAASKLQELAPLPEGDIDICMSENQNTVYFGPFSIPRGPLDDHRHQISLQAPTTRENMMRVVRACQLPKPILLEGSPGVGKTSLVTALANIFGYQLYRINLSDQTDLSDLFGSDLPVEHGKFGQFVWKDAEFLKALQEGQWVLLDEMNLAPQAILEGLNAALDHRGTVYIPELGRSFTRHPSFRIFAAQNPLHQGGGRKGLPKSFLNRFTKVHIRELTPQDIFLVCKDLFVDQSEDQLRGMINYLSLLSDEVLMKRSFARDGAPWEFNLRDMIRWGSLLQKAGPHTHPRQFISTLFLQRFRTDADRRRASALSDSISSDPARQISRTPTVSLSPSYFQVGPFFLARSGLVQSYRTGRVLQSHQAALEAIGASIVNGWLTILVGPRDSGKTTSVRVIAQLSGAFLEEIYVNSATDAADLLGGFEEVDVSYRLHNIVDRILFFIDAISSSANGSKYDTAIIYDTLKSSLTKSLNARGYQEGLRDASALLDKIEDIPESLLPQRDGLRQELKAVLAMTNKLGTLEWVDGPLVRALKQGHWLLLDGANMCNPSVLDRLNSLCENDGALVLNERGSIEGVVPVIKPHPKFRLFMSVESQYGELSRAMRNRGLEVAMVEDLVQEDRRKLRDHLRLPAMVESLDEMALSTLYELIRRGTQIPLAVARFEWPGGQLIGEHCPTSWSTELTPLLRASAPVSATLHRSLAHFVPTVSVPSYMWHLFRVLQAASNASATTRCISSILHHLHSVHGFHAFLDIRDSYARSHGIPSEFVLSKPLDAVLVNPPPPEVDRVLDDTMRALDLLVALQLDDEHNGSLPLTSIDLAANSVDRVVVDSKIFQVARNTKSLLGEMRISAQKLLNTSAWGHSSRADIDKALELVTYGRHLRIASGGSPIDYSSIRVFIRWILEALADYDVASPIHDRAKDINDIVCAKSGLGLTDIWHSLLGMDIPDHHLAQAHRLEGACSRISDSKETLDYRSQILDMMSIVTAPATTPNANAGEFDRLAKHLIDRSAENPNPGRSVNIPDSDDITLIIELGILQRIEPSCGNCLPEHLTRVLHAWIDYGRRYLKLFHLTSYRQLLWVNNNQEAWLPCVARSHRKWLEDVWSATIAEVAGPAALFMPIELYGTSSECALKQKNLDCLQTYEMILRRRLDFLISPTLASGETRLKQLSQLFMKEVIMLSSCFEGSSQRGLSSSPDSCIPHAASSLPVAQIISNLEQIAHEGFSRSFGEHLRPALQQLNMSLRAPDDMIHSDLGLAWIALGRLVLDLYVPDTPIDPAAMQRCEINFWKEEVAMLSTLVELHLKYAKRTSGKSSSVSVRRAEGLLLDAEQHIARASTATLPSRTDISQLHSFWTEVAQFVAQVVSPAKVTSIVEALNSREAHATMREIAIQNSLSAFTQRLRTVYPDFADLSGPIHLAVLFMKFGLRLAAYGITAANASHDETRFMAALVAFPSVRSAALMGAHGALSSPSIPIQQTLLGMLTGIALEVSLGVHAAAHIEQVDLLYEQAFGLWSINRARQEEATRNAQSLYRSNTLDSQAITDADLEEQDFISVFPQYEDIFDTDPLSYSTAKRQEPRLGDSVERLSIGELHQYIFSRDLRHPPVPRISAAFMSLRRSLLTFALDARVNIFPESLDRGSRPFQIAMLHDHLAGVHQKPLEPTAVYNFYTDTNVSEIQRAADFISDLHRRLDALVQEWPDQMVLQNLQNRCIAILTFDMSSPVAKVLSAVEQLLLQIEDWEMYSNRENTLKAYQQRLTGLVVEWRRLELASWQGLLEAQAVSFAKEATDWWHRLYEAIIRGARSAASEEEQGRDDAVTQYLDGLVPLVDEFVISSPIGQYHERLGLLSSFAEYCSDQNIDVSSHYGSALDRLHRILKFATYYYGHHAEDVSSTLSKQRAVLEKEIRDYIKLASWRDVNVHALKQSAQKTHRQLYKSIKKFREVLRQPVAEILRRMPERRDELLSPHPSVVAVSPDVHIPPMAIPLASAPHLVNLEKTYQTFRRLITDRITASRQSPSIRNLKDLAMEVIATSDALAKAIVPSNLDTSQRSKYLKSLLTQKRRAWSEFLKELKRIGFATNVKPEVLERQRNPRWLREQKLISETRSIIGDDGNYIYRLASILPELRASLSEHHQDITTRELQRGIMLLESGFTMGLEGQIRINEAAVVFRRLQQLVSRLCLLSADKIASSGHGLLPQVSTLKDTLCKLVNALEEILQQIHDHNVYHPSVAISPGDVGEVQALIASTSTMSTRMSKLLIDVRSTSLPILLEGENHLLSTAKQHISAVENTLQRWSASGPPLSYYAMSMSTWLGESANLLPHASQPTLTTADSTSFLIDAVLISIQTVLPLHSTDKTEAESDDDFIRRDHRLNHQLIRALRLDIILNHANQVLHEVSTCTADEVQNRTTRILPFLNRFLEFAEEQLLRQSEWTRSLLKFEYIASTVVRTVAREGFCKPPDSDESGSGGEGMEIQADGTGLGEGSGTDNVSKDIQEESQVEGLQGEDTATDEQVERAEDNNAIEMSEDVGGQLQDVSDAESEGEETGEQDSEDVDMEEQLGDLDASDPAAVDEKLWGDEGGPQGSDDDSKIDEDRSSGNKPSEMVAKDEKSGKKSDSNETAVNEPEDDAPDTDDREEGDGKDVDDANGAPLDSHIDEANTLDLPDDMDLEGMEDQQQPNVEEDLEMEDLGETAASTFEEDDSSPSETDADPVDQTAPAVPDHDESMEGEQQREASPDPSRAEDTQGDHEDYTLPKADLHGGEGIDSGVSEGVATSASEVRRDGDDQRATQQDPVAGEEPSSKSMDENTDVNAEIADDESSKRQQAKPTPSGTSANAAETAWPEPGAMSTRPIPPQSSSNNTLRSLGDTLREINRQLDEIMDNKGPSDRPTQSQSDAPAQMEYLHPDDVGEDLQALGPASKEESVKLDELTFMRDTSPPVESAELIERDQLQESQLQKMSGERIHAERTSHVLGDGVESAMASMDLRSQLLPSEHSNDSSAPHGKIASPETLEEKSREVELQLREWQDQGEHLAHAGDIWRLYESLTHDLSYALCEQLRLILEPTMATRLKGDYRTGKRLNMKKIIPYIASDFTKDKIWLRRTRPSQREYQVLVALDDSRSMAESHSVHLAYETLALVSKALSRLEVGDIAIAKFGESVEILHGFESGPFTDQAGSKLISAFRFDQKATQVLSLMDTSLKLLGQARDRRSISSASASDLWQLEIIISDGMCQDHEKLRTVLRKAEEERVMVVFIILDSLHARSSAEAHGTAQNSILTMNQVAYKNIDGRLDLHVERYLDSFPFEYYIVLRDVEALPDVLSGTLKQFFERIAES